MSLAGTPFTYVIRVRLGAATGNRVLFPVVEAYLLRCGERWFIVDTGPPGSAPVILAALKRHGIPTGAVSNIVLTHGHFDHFGSALALRRSLGSHVRIAMHPADRAFLTGQAFPSHLRPTSIAGAFPMLAGCLWMGFASTTHQLPAWTEADVSQVIWLDEVSGEAPVSLEERLDLPLRAIHTPGHSAGSICLLTRAGELFSGDIISHSLFGAPAWPLLADNPKLILSSLQRIAGLNPTVVYPGHGAPMPGEAVEKLVRRLSERRKILGDNR